MSPAHRSVRDRVICCVRTHLGLLVLLRWSSRLDQPANATIDLATTPRQVHERAGPERQSRVLEAVAVPEDEKPSTSSPGGLPSSLAEQWGKLPARSVWRTSFCGSPQRRGSLQTHAVDVNVESSSSRALASPRRRARLVFAMGVCFVICNMDKVNISVAIIPMAKVRITSSLSRAQGRCQVLLPLPRRPWTPALRVLPRSSAGPPPSPASSSPPSSGVTWHPSSPAASP